jgi:hypothetical protein
MQVYPIQSYNGKCPLCGKLCLIHLIEAQRRPTMPRLAKSRAVILAEMDELFN